MTETDTEIFYMLQDIRGPGMEVLMSEFQMRKQAILQAHQKLKTDLAKIRLINMPAAEVATQRILDEARMRRYSPSL